ncbi:ribosome biogenesis GTP-binding protein YihA/YsxC [soil metagenome]
MKIETAEFVGGMIGPDPLLFNGTPQIAFIGRSNVGKSTLINTLTKQKDLARTSSFPGRTQEINLFLINKSRYLVDLPGYGFAKLSKVERQKIDDLIHWYFFDSEIEQKKVVLIIDANIGLTKSDEEMLYALEVKGKEIIVVANKVDKIPKNKLSLEMKRIQARVGVHKVLFASALDKKGIGELSLLITT